MLADVPGNNDDLIAVVVWSQLPCRQITDQPENVRWRQIPIDRAVSV